MIIYYVYIVLYYDLIVASSELSDSLHALHVHANCPQLPTTAHNCPQLPTTAHLALKLLWLKLGQECHGYVILH